MHEASSLSSCSEDLMVAILEILLQIQHYCRIKKHIPSHLCLEKIYTRNSMNLAGYRRQLLTCMRPYKSKHPTFTNSCQIGSRKPVLLLKFTFFKQNFFLWKIKCVIVKQDKALCVSSTRCSWHTQNIHATTTLHTGWMLVTIYTCIHVLHIGYLHRELRAIFYVHRSFFDI